MTNRLPYQTTGGAFSASITFSQLIEFIRLAQEDCRALADWAKVYESRPKAKAWTAIAENFDKIVPVLERLGKGKTKTSVGFVQ
jgi:hypothetical protein